MFFYECENVFRKCENASRKCDKKTCGKIGFV